jgi:hypothetical protein
MDHLLGMGFDEALARRAMDAAGGSVEHALNLLLNSQETGHEIGGAGEGGEQIVRLGCSQYSFEVGASACTPIACTLVSAVLSSLANGDQNFLDSATLTGKSKERVCCCVVILLALTCVIACICALFCLASFADLVFTGVGSYLATMGESVEHLAAEELYNISDTLKQRLRIVGSPHQVRTPHGGDCMNKQVYVS